MIIYQRQNQRKNEVNKKNEEKTTEWMLKTQTEWASELQWNK